MGDAIAKVRAFLAVYPDSSLVEEVQKFQREMQSHEAACVVRWAPRTQFHCTLKFLGEIPVSSLPEAEEAVRRVCRGIPPFRLNFGKPGCFPNAGRPSIIWLGLEGNVETLNRLRLRIDEELKIVQRAETDTPFHAHLTLGRVRTPGSPEAARMGGYLQSLSTAWKDSWQVRQVDMMRSDLSTKGAMHTLLFSVPLGEHGGVS